MNSKIELLELIQMARNHMEAQGYTYTSVSCYMKTWRSVYNYGLSKGIAHYSAELAEQYMLEKYRLSIGENAAEDVALSPYMTQKIRALRALTDFKLHGHIPRITHGEAVLWPDEYKELCIGFMNEYKALGYSDGSYRRHELNLCRFVCFLHTRNISPKEIETVHIFEYFKTLAHFSRSQLANLRGTLVHSLNYFYKMGICAETLAESVPRVRYYASAKVNKVWSEDEIKRMLGSIDRANPTGKRDYAIMVISANLGLRPGDILNLSIDCFDWKSGCINLVQGKTGEPLVLPLTEQIGKAVIDYWTNGRPSTVAAEVFVQHTLPYQKLTVGMIYHMFNKYYESSGIVALENRRHGLYSFRHSLASRLLEKGTPVNVIGNILGHVNSNSAHHYLRIDMEKLRKCTLEVPDYE
jgi:integrase/recombinase XerD